MPQLIATVLGMILIAVMGVNIAHRYEAALAQAVFQAEVGQAARQEASFARSVLAYVTKNSPAAGTTLTPAVLEAADLLSPGFPSTNPFGQTPVAYVGTNEAALVTYTAVPSSSYLAPVGLSATSVINLENLAYQEADNIAAMQAGFPALSGAMLYDGSLSTPHQSIVLSVATYVAGATLPAGPIFADLVNIVSQPTLSTPSTTSYGSVTGD